MSRCLDVLAGVVLFAVGGLFFSVFFVGLHLSPFFAEPLWRTWLGIIAGLTCAAAAFILLWSQPVGGRLGIVALITLGVVLLLNRFVPLWHLNVDAGLIGFLSVLACAAGLLYWRFVSTPRAE
jgi:hypothetical protein